MMNLPLEAILFWIAVMLAPADTSQILVKGPGAMWAWTKQSSGWSFSADRSLWVAEGKTMTTTRKEKDGTTVEKVEQFVQGVKDHDWKKSAVLRLEPDVSLAKNGETYVYTRDEGTPAAKQYSIRFRRQPAASPKATGDRAIGEKPPAGGNKSVPE